MTQALVLILAAWVAAAVQAPAQTREEKVLADRARTLADGFWMYNDLPAGIAQAQKTGKPLLVVLRCISCVKCVKGRPGRSQGAARRRPSVAQAADAGLTIAPYRQLTR
jgi:hypothetical protein